MYLRKVPDKRLALEGVKNHSKKRIKIRSLPSLLQRLLACFIMAGTENAERMAQIKLITILFGVSILGHLHIWQPLGGIPI